MPATWGTRPLIAAGLHDCSSRAAERHENQRLPPGQLAWWLCRWQSQLLQPRLGCSVQHAIAELIVPFHFEEAHLALLHSHG